jgi:hypothetical protein
MNVGNAGLVMASWKAIKCSIPNTYDERNARFTLGPRQPR